MYEDEKLACIPKNKVCDGYADLAFADMEGRYKFRLCGNNGYYSNVDFFLDEAYCPQNSAMGMVRGMMVAAIVLTMVIAGLTIKSLFATLGSCGRGLLSCLETQGEFVAAGKQTLQDEERSEASA